MDNEIIVPGFSEGDLGGGKDAFLGVLDSAPDVSALPDIPVTYTDDSGSGASLRAYESATFSSQENPTSSNHAERIQELLDKSSDEAPIFTTEQHGYHEPTWDALQETTGSKPQSISDVDPMLSAFFEHTEVPKNIPKIQEVTNPEDNLIKAVTLYITTVYSLQLKLCKPNLSEVLAKNLVEKIKSKILPDYFEKKCGNGTPYLSDPEKPKVQERPAKEKFDFRKFVTTDF